MAKRKKRKQKDLLEAFFNWNLCTVLLQTIIIYLAKKSYDFLCVSFLVFSRAAPTAYGGSQARGPIGVVATGLRHSHSDVGSEPHLQPTPQLTATPDP